MRTHFLYYTMITYLISWRNAICRQNKLWWSALLLICKSFPFPTTTTWDLGPCCGDKFGNLDDLVILTKMACASLFTDVFSLLTSLEDYLVANAFSPALFNWWSGRKLNYKVSPLCLYISLNLTMLCSDYS